MECHGRRVALQGTYARLEMLDVLFKHLRDGGSGVGVLAVDNIGPLALIAGGPGAITSLLKER